MKRQHDFGRKRGGVQDAPEKTALTIRLDDVSFADIASEQKNVDCRAGAGDSQAMREICRTVAALRSTLAARRDLLFENPPCAASWPYSLDWIAALCVEHQVKLATVDGHFDAVDGLQRLEH